MLAQRLREIKQEVAAGADVPAEQTYEVEHLRGHRHTPEGLSLRVVWHPRYGAADSWEPAENLRTEDSDQELLTNYLAMLQRARVATALLGEQCPVCFTAYRGAPDHTIVTRFNCQHQCCAGCADNWRREHSRLTATCPICRAPIGSGRVGSIQATVGDLRTQEAWAADRENNE